MTRQGEWVEVGMWRDVVADTREASEHTVVVRNCTHRHEKAADGASTPHHHHHRHDYESESLGMFVS